MRDGRAGRGQRGAVESSAALTDGPGRPAGVRFGPSVVSALPLPHHRLRAEQHCCHIRESPPPLLSPLSPPHAGGGWDSGAGSC